jgi:spermidine/putrescine transport system ATP-binding protein
MNDGRVAQCGPPEEIYENPSEQFVAGFIGISNLLEGTVEDGGRVRVGTTGLSIPAALPADSRPGDLVSLSVRPEKIAVEEVEDGMVAVEGTIEARVYLGVMTQITVSLGDGARLVALEQATYRSRADDRWEPGMKIKLGWHPEHAQVLR